MKVILSLSVFILMTFPMLSKAQNSGINGLFDKYFDKDNYTSVEISKGLFELFANIDSDDEDIEEFQKAVEGIEKLKLVSYSAENGDMAEKERFYNDIESSVPFDKYDELMVVKKDGATINFYSKGGGRNIRELLMVVNGNTDVIFMSITGNIDLKHLAKLGSSMNIDGLDYLGEIGGD